MLPTTVEEVVVLPKERSDDAELHQRQLLDRAIELQPKLAVTHWSSAYLFRKQGEYESAERAYERAVEVDPDDEQAQGKSTEWRAYIADVRHIDTPPMKLRDYVG